MSAAVQSPSDRSGPAFLISLLLHGTLVALSMLAAVLGHGPAPVALNELPNSVAMQGNSIEVEAPTPELAATPAAPAAAGEPAPLAVEALPKEPAARQPAPTVAEKGEPIEAPKPRATAPRRAREKVPAKPARASSEAASAAAAAASAGAPSAGTFGQEGLAPGVRRLGYAFTRAIPAATPADAEWRELPPGPVGTIRIELEVDENNRLGAMKEWHARPGEPAPPAILRRMVERTLILLRAGQFALSGSNQPGTERLVIDVTLNDGAAEEEGQAVVVQKGFDGATPGHPGRAHFRYGSGRRFEAKVTIAPGAPR
jgi:hypothetical protein